MARRLALAREGRLELKSEMARTRRDAGSRPTRAVSAVPALSERSIRHNRRVGRRLFQGVQAAIAAHTILSERVTHPARDYDASTTDANVEGRRPSALDNQEAAAFSPEVEGGAVEAAASIATASGALREATASSPAAEVLRAAATEQDSLFGAQIGLERMRVAVPPHLAALNLPQPMERRYRMPAGESISETDTTVVVRPGPDMESDPNKDAWTLWMWKLVTALEVEKCAWQTLNVLKDGRVPDNVVVTTCQSIGNTTPILVTAFLVDIDMDLMYPMDITNWYWNGVCVMNMRAVRTQLRSSIFSKLTSAIVDVESCDGVTDFQVKTLYDTAKHCYDVMCLA